MKKQLLILLITLGSSLYAFLPAQHVAEGEFTIGGSNQESGFCIVNTNDKGYAVSGFTSSYGAGGMDIFLVKFDSLFNIMWTKTIGGRHDESGISMVQTKDRGYVITGGTNSYGDTVNNDVYIVKLDSMGTLQWTKTVGGPALDIGDCIIQTNDGGYAITGDTYSYGAGDADIYVIKLDALGNLKWTKTIGGTTGDYGRSIIQTKDKGYAIAGTTTSFGKSSYNMYVVKLDSVGNMKWSKTIGDTVYEEGYSVIQTVEGGYAVAGATSSFGSGVNNVYVVKLDSTGSLTWAKTIGNTLGNDHGYRIIQTKDKGYAISGGTDYYNTGNEVGHVIKLDSSGALKWTKIIGNQSVGFFYSIVQTEDGGYAVPGYSNANGGDMLIVKLNSFGNTCDTTSGPKYESTGGTITSSDSGRVGTGGSITSTDSGRVGNGGNLSIICEVAGISNINNCINNSNIFPNPCTTTLNIDFASPAEALAKEGVFTLQVTDITGRVLFTDHCHLCTDHFALDVSSLARGMYFLRLSSADGAEVKKFIKE